MQLEAEVLIRAEDVRAELRSEWDAMAVAAGRPFCAPGWLLGWWAHAAPPDAQLRLVVVRQGSELVGVAPWFAARSRIGGEGWRLLGGQAAQRVEPLTVARQAAEVTTAIAGAIAAFGPAWLSFDGVPVESRWPQRLAESWPGRRVPWRHPRTTVPALTIDVEGRDFDAWYMSKTSHFRQRLRKGRKQLEGMGGSARLATPATVAADLETFVRLHRSRWEAKDGESAVTPAIGRMLLEASRSLPVPDRLRVWTLEVEGEAIASSVVLGAGDEMGYWSNGFDARHASISPSRLSVLTVVEDAFASGCRRLDLGAGDFEYKRRFADGEEALEWTWLVPPGPRHGLVRSWLATERHGRVAVGRLPPAWEARVRALRARER